MWLIAWQAETWVAICTGVLAGATFLLALFTWRMAGAASSEVAITVRPLIVDAPMGVFLREEEAPYQKLSALLGEAGRTRWIVDPARPQTSVQADRIELTFAVRNGGTGPALLSQPEVRKREDGAAWPSDASTPTARISHTLLPLNEPARITVTISYGDFNSGIAEKDREYRESAEARALTDAKSLQGLVVSIGYTDLTGRQHGRSEFQVHDIAVEGDPAFFAVRRVDLFQKGRFGPERLFATLESLA